MMYSAYKLNKQGDSIQPWHTLFPICNQSVVPCPVLTVASWPAYRFLKRQVRWSGIPISWRIFHSLLLSTHSKALAQSILYSWCVFFFFSSWCILSESFFLDFSLLYSIMYSAPPFSWLINHPNYNILNIIVWIFSSSYTSPPQKRKTWLF